MSYVAACMPPRSNLSLYRNTCIVLYLRARAIPLPPWLPPRKNAGMPPAAASQERAARRVALASQCSSSAGRRTSAVPSQPPIRRASAVRIGRTVPTSRCSLGAVIPVPAVPSCPVDPLARGPVAVNARAEGENRVCRLGEHGMSRLGDLRSLYHLPPNSPYNWNQAPGVYSQKPCKPKAITLCRS